MDTCRICGMNFSSRSFGGPGVCPACDCGIPLSQRMRMEMSAGVTPEQIRQIVREELQAAFDREREINNVG